MANMIAALFASIAFITVMVKVLLDSIHVGASDPIYILEISFFAAGVFGLIGFYLGRVLEEGKQVADSTKGKEREKDKELLIDDILIYDVGIQKKPEEKEETTEQPK